MEPPTKRPRLGPPPPGNYDDPEADELNERPEDVNARRDPAVQLERSRAFAAFKLKSAFERIFEKYERDFTGVSDEIDLRTGEIVVDNGHVQSLVGAQLGGAENGEGEGDEEGSEDGASEAGSLNEEERMVRGQVDNRLSWVGQIAPPSIPPQIGPPPFLAGGWPGPAPVMGGPPGFPGMMYAGQMDYGGFPMQYGTPIPIPTTDPAWSTPALPSPFVRNALASKEAAVSVKKKVSRLSLSAAREHDGADEDDIFLDVSAPGKDGGKDEGFVMKQKVLLARPPPEKASAGKKKKLPGTKPKQAQGGGKLGKHEKAKKLPAKGKSLGSTPTAQPQPAPKATSTAREVGLQLDREHPDVYVNLADDGDKLARIPRNQILRIEIPARKPQDIHSFRIITPEPSEADFLKPQNAVMGELRPGKDTPAPEARDMVQAAQAGIIGPRSGNKAQEVVETFSRNIVDPAYGFSDEDEPTLPRRRKAQNKTNKPKLAQPTITEPAVLREISRNVSSGTASGGRDMASNTPSKEVNEWATTRAPSPTLSLDLGDVPDRHEGDVLGSFGGGGGTDTAPEPSVTEISIKMGDKEAVTSSQPTERRMSMDIAENPPVVLPGPEAAALRKTNRRRRSSKIQPSETPNKTPGKLDIRGSRSLAPPRRPEIPETSPNAQPTASPLPASSSLPAPTSAIQDSDPPFSPEEQTQDIPNQSDRAPSPTLTDPSSRPQTTLPPPRSAPAKTTTTTTTPHTPTKTPTRRRPKTHHPPQHPPPSPSTHPPPTSTSTSTAKTKKKGLLSLLPTTGNASSASSSSDDDLSILTPAKPPSTTTLRTTPASHHVRLGLLATTATNGGGGGGGGGTSSSAGTKLRRAVLTGGPVRKGKRSSIGGAAAQTPARGGGGRRKKSGAGGVGLGAAGGPPWTPSSRLALLESGELVQTPGGTVRRCGEDGFRCEREFCFSCL